MSASSLIKAARSSADPLHTAGSGTGPRP